MLRLVILGGGGHASDVLGVVEALQRTGELIEVVGLLDDETPDPSRFIGRDVPHLGPITMIDQLDANYVLAMGYPTTRRAVFEKIRHMDRRPATLVHPAAVIGAGCDVGAGAVIFDGVHLSAMARVGEHSCISYNSSVGHDSRIGDFCSIMPGATVSGSVVVGNDVMVGANAIVVEQRRIDNGASIGAGAVVVDDVSANTIVAGVPARPLSPRE